MRLVYNTNESEHKRCFVKKEGRTLMKKCLALIAAMAMLVMCACGEVVPAENDEKTTSQKTIAEMNAAARKQGKTAEVSITEIDMTMPENEAYRNWMETDEGDFYDYPAYDEFIPKPSKRRKKNPPDSEAFDQWRLHYSPNAYWPKKTWKTWDWNDEWEIELYKLHYNGKYGDVDWKVLRARNKLTGEIEAITETMSEYGSDGGYSSPYLVSIKDEYILYGIAGYDYFSLYFYAPGQGSTLMFEEERAWDLAGPEHTLLCWAESVWDDDIHYEDVYCADLRKMAAGEPNAVQKITEKSRKWFSDMKHSPDGGWLLFLADDEEGKRWFTIYDLVAGREVYSAQRPVPHGAFRWVSENTLYYFGKDDDKQAWLYEIRLSFAVTTQYD